MLEQELVDRLGLFYKMFADPTRIQILALLCEKSLCVGEIVKQLGRTQSSVSHQLQTLRIANFVKYEKVGKEVFYSLADDHIKVILKYGLEHIKEGGTL